MDLTDKRVVVTRPRRQADNFAKALQRLGAQPILFPVIQISPEDDTIALDRALSKLECYEWLVLTSVNGVRAVWERMQTLGMEEIPAGVRVAAIGPKTAAALRERGVSPNFVPDEYIAEAILPGLGDLRGRWVLLPRADLARPALPQAIQTCDGVAHEIAAYRTLPGQPDPHSIGELRTGVDVVTFTSSSTVHNFVTLVRASGLDPKNLPGDPIFACIGPVTAETAKEEGLSVDVVAEEYTIEGLLAALQER